MSQVTPRPPLDIARPAEMWLSEAQIDLGSLHAVLAIMAADPDLSSRYYRFLRRIRETVHPRGVSDVRTVRLGEREIEVDLGEDPGCDLYYGLLRTAVGRDLFLSLLFPDDVVVDVGAGFGLYALASAGIVAEGGGAVHAFETRPDQLRLLEHNAERQGVASVLHGHALGLEVEAAESPLDGTARWSPDERHQPHATGLDGVLPTLGLHHLDSLHVSSACDVSAVLAGGWQIVRASPDPVVVVDLDEDRLGPDGRARLLEELTFLDDCGFTGVAVDHTGAVRSRWQVDGEMAAHTQSVLFVRRAGNREETLRALLPTASARGIRHPAIRERAPDASGAAEPSTTAAPLIAALAVARLRELDELTGQVGAYLLLPDDAKRADEATDHDLLTGGPTVRAVELLALQAEVDRLQTESDVRLSEARALRQEAKRLRSRYEVAGGQRVRGLAGAALRLAGKLRGSSDS